MPPFTRDPFPLKLLGVFVALGLASMLGRYAFAANDDRGCFPLASGSCVEMRIEEHSTSSLITCSTRTEGRIFFETTNLRLCVCNNSTLLCAAVATTTTTTTTTTTSTTTTT